MELYILISTVCSLYLIIAFICFASFSSTAPTTAMKVIHGLLSLVWPLVILVGTTFIITARWYQWVMYHFIGETE